MKKYIGTKVIKARPMTMGVYAEYGGLYLSREHDPAEEGFFIGHPEKDGEFSGDFEGGSDYITWLPTEKFNRVFKPMTGMSFGLAIEAMKLGYKVARKGWDGKGMWIELQTPTDKSKMTAPYIYMKTADDNLVPWLASQTDILAEDWIVV